jgi:D-alanine-D-alanine ligase-like ATP-grasp enzyme
VLALMGQLQPFQMFGGLDICTVDAIHDRDSGNEYIIEVNDTSSGLAPENAEEDNRQIRDLTLAKMSASLCQSRK